MQNIDIDSKCSPFYGINYIPDSDRWMIYANLLDLKADSLSCKKFGFRKAKLIICQMM
jgi:hypothetical protein